MDIDEIIAVVKKRAAHLQARDTRPPPWELTLAWEVARLRVAAGQLERELEVDIDPYVQQAGETARLQQDVVAKGALIETIASLLMEKPTHERLA